MKQKNAKTIVIVILLLIIALILIGFSSKNNERKKQVSTNQYDIKLSGDISGDNNNLNNENISGDINTANSGDNENKSGDKIIVNGNNLNGEIIENWKDYGWELILVNSRYVIPQDYTFTLENIDSSRQFDDRAISYFRQMMSDARKDGITNFWAQSTYRSISLQDGLYNNKVKLYKNRGYSEEEAMKLAEQIVNRPGHSEHNIGLCVDFNNVDDSFALTKAFTWLKKNAENYGFVLRYDSDKEDITGVTYEPWHWRYVGLENAKKMNNLGMCLEEYIMYLQGELDDEYLKQLQVNKKKKEEAERREEENQNSNTNGSTNSNESTNTNGSTNINESSNTNGNTNVNGSTNTNGSSNTNGSTNTSGDTNVNENTNTNTNNNNYVSGDSNTNNGSNEQGNANNSQSYDERTYGEKNDDSNENNKNTENNKNSEYNNAESRNNEINNNEPNNNESNNNTELNGDLNQN